MSNSLSTLVAMSPAGRAVPGRARPLPPDERRAALVAATLPLVAVHGVKVTTRQIADAAGVAEGTIFRVFADKDELVQAAIAAALDPEPLFEELSRVDLAEPAQKVALGPVVGAAVHRCPLVRQRRRRAVLELVEPARGLLGRRSFGVALAHLRMVRRGPA